jgi:phosphopantothenoylcysteine decarboxylase/phosphopantothenate--cysteine ligase
MRLHSGNWVYTDFFDYRGDTIVPHIELTRRADLFLVMPATANILAKGANGIADDLVSLAIVAASCPVLFVPSMNSVMWQNQAVQKNVRTLRVLGHRVMEPTEGLEISNLEPTHGCMPSLSRVADEISALVLARTGRPEARSH